jgi:glutamine synthetase
MATVKDLTFRELANASIHVDVPLPDGGQRTVSNPQTVMRETYAETADSGIAHVQWFVITPVVSRC